MKVVFHVDELEKWQVVLGNIRNILAYSQSTGESFVIEVVANGAAITECCGRTAANKELYPAMLELSAHVDFRACRNAMRSHGIAENELFPFITAVPAGVVEIIMRQADGFAYIKP